MMTLLSYFQSHWLVSLIGGFAIVLTWIVTNWIGKPLLEFMSDRRQALEAIQVHGSVGSHSSEERVKEAWRAIATVAARMMFYAQGGPGIVRVYCRMRRYDLELAGLTLNGVHRFIGANVSRDVQQNQSDAARVALGATGLMSVDRKNEIRAMMRNALEDPPRDDS
jgi:membrane-bound metal-dependent hydrolase YbcI (DUF457 family)